MDQIDHKYVEVNGLKLHVPEISVNGSEVVLFCHGFPEIWYSWRHQMIVAAKAGYRAITPDYRGYGLSDPPPVPGKATFINDLNSLLDVLGISKEPGRAEADFGRVERKAVFRNIYILLSRHEIPIAGENQEIMDLVDSSAAPLPSWLTEKDLETYGALYEKSGFQTPLQVPYRSTCLAYLLVILREEFNISEEVKVQVRLLLIMGEKDYSHKFTRMESFIRNEESKEFVPKLKTVYIAEGTHFVQEQFLHQVNEILLNFLKNHS